MDLITQLTTAKVDLDSVEGWLSIIIPLVLFLGTTFLTLVVLKLIKSGERSGSEGGFLHSLRSVWVEAPPSAAQIKGNFVLVLPLALVALPLIWLYFTASLAGMLPLASISAVGAGLSVGGARHMSMLDSKPK